MFGNACPAAASELGARAENEDCLVLNVWRPKGSNRRDRLPVYVFIHGGASTFGSAAQFDMAELVRRTGVIGVSINYRLGALGFLSVPGLSQEAGESGNYGLQDQQLALRWVRRNIAAFGGDPRRVTVGGESAGAWSICAHLSAPASKRLFAQVMLQSMPASCPTQTQQQAETLGSGMATRLGCPAGPAQVACLRATPVGRLLDEFGAGPPFPVRGTATVPTDPRKAIADGEFARVPVVVGFNRDEGRTFARGFIGATREQYVAFLEGAFPQFADAVLARYPWPSRPDRFTAAYLIGAVMTDSGSYLSVGACSTLRLLRDLDRHTRTYAYRFDARTGPGQAPIPGFVWGAGHAGELPYLFPTYHLGLAVPPQFDAAEHRLARDMKRYWGAFVSTGSPNVGQAKWPRFNRTNRFMSLRRAGSRATVTRAAIRRQHECGFWDRHAPGPEAPASPATSPPPE